MKPLKAQTAPKYTDDTVMPFGKYKGEPLANVPDKWLIWYYEENKFKKDDPLVEYIFESGLV
jgi:hypothetical protein